MELKLIEFCEGCGKPIVWLRTEKGKAMPCQPKKINILTEEGKIVYGYEPHWGYCPRAEEFRGGKS